jgi:hypothetical protein
MEADEPFRREAAERLLGRVRDFIVEASTIYIEQLIFGTRIELHALPKFYPLPLIAITVFQQCISL